MKTEKPGVFRVRTSGLGDIWEQLALFCDYANEKKCPKDAKLAPLPPSLSQISR